jgi:putative nucleotidyltransferase with HDIG domain
MLRTRVRAGAVAGAVMSLAFAALLTAANAPEAILPKAVVSHLPGLYPSAEPNPVRLGSHFVVQTALLLVASTYLRRFGPARARALRTQAGLFAAIVGLLVLSKALLLFLAGDSLWIPVEAAALWCALVLDRRTAFAIGIIAALIASALLDYDMTFMVTALARTIASTIVLTAKKQPAQIARAATFGAVAGAFACASFEIGLLTPRLVAAALGPRSPLLSAGAGGLIAGAVAIAIRRPMESLLGGVTRDRLIDLTDLEQPLLQKMATETPGSWEHSRAMANLAEAAAAAIGADTLLTRVGAYYHDLGKTIQPKYFVENLLPGERSPHEDLEPEVSADAIMAHVVQGTKLLRDEGIPEAVVEFAYTHHGTQTIEFFWHKCQKAGNPKNLTEEFFRYPGMKPQTRETAILMLVDSIEAASRTIQPPERGKFEEMIQRVVFTKLKSGQLDESGLAVEDLKTLTIKMSDTLTNMFHGRIKYPWQKEGRESTPSIEPPTKKIEKPN